MTSPNIYGDNINRNFTLPEAKAVLLEAVIPPDDITLNHKPWKLESTYTSRADALGSAGMMESYRLFKYSQGYALYERNYSL